MGGERRLTASLARFFGSHRDVAVGIGDDAAVLRSRHPNSVVCCDPVLAGVHFDATAPLPLVGRKAVNRNLSDLAAMGAAADWLLVSVIAPPGFGEHEVSAVLRGVRHAARQAGAVVVGGDLARSRGPFVVTVTAIGHLDGPPLVRTGARAGDSIHVSGALGGSRAGHHLRFRPALAEGRWLAEQAPAIGAVDRRQRRPAARSRHRARGQRRTRCRARRGGRAHPCRRAHTRPRRPHPQLAARARGRRGPRAVVDAAPRTEAAGRWPLVGAGPATDRPHPRRTRLVVVRARSPPSAAGRRLRT